MYQNEQETQKRYYLRPRNYSSNQGQNIGPNKVPKDHKPVKIFDSSTPINKLATSQNPGVKFTPLVVQKKAGIPNLKNKRQKKKEPDKSSHPFDLEHELYKINIYIPLLV